MHNMVKVEEITDISIGGYKAQRIISVSKDKKRPLTTVMYNINGGSKVYGLIYSGLTEDFKEKYLPVFEKMANSFKIGSKK